jgi:hypothetical protein
VQSANDLAGIYSGGFVTALAAASPEEDFVESYSISVIRQVCPGCMFGIWIPATGAGSAFTALHNDRGHSELKSKFSCVSDKHINQSRH